MSLYNMGAFKSWGHFAPEPSQFPSGAAGVKACVDKAAKLGLRIGVHTLTSFIHTYDPYITPIPDKRLAITGSSALTQPINAVGKEIQVESKYYFTNLTRSTLHAVRLGNEIIRYRDVTPEFPYTLLDCQRAAFGTREIGSSQGRDRCHVDGLPLPVSPTHGGCWVTAGSTAAGCAGWRHGLTRGICMRATLRGDCGAPSVGAGPVPLRAQTNSPTGGSV